LDGASYRGRTDAATDGAASDGHRDADGVSGHEVDQLAVLEDGEGCDHACCKPKVSKANTDRGRVWFRRLRD